MGESMAPFLVMAQVKVDSVAKELKITNTKTKGAAQNR